MTALRTAAILFLFALVCACPVAAPLSAATITWDNGGVSQDWTDDGAGGNWSGDPAPGPGDNALFDENTDGGASGTTTNVVDTNFTIANLDYAVSASGAGTFFHTTEIAASTTLLATAGLDVLPATIDSNETLDVTIRGGAGSALQVGNVGGSTADIRIARNQLGTLDTITGNLDLSGLETFVAHLDDFEISVGVRPADAIVTLAEDNSITANSLVMGIGTGNNSNTPSELLLGETNTINANQLFIARTKSRATVEFQTGLVAPDVTIRGKAGGSSRADLEIGVQTGSTGSTGIGIVDFSGGTVDALLDRV